METSYRNPLPDTRPDILEVVGRYTSLRKVGREYKGLCSFHCEKTPSFTVNVDKGVFYCHGCHAGGDVIDFVKLIEQTDFKGALKILGIKGGEYKPKPKDQRKQRAAAMLADWLNQQHLKIGAMLRELTQFLVIAEEAGSALLIERWSREFALLERLFDDLQRAECAAELWAVRDSIEAITARAPVEALPPFPEWTREYAEYLAGHLPAPEAGQC